MLDNYTERWLEYEGKQVGFIVPYNNIADKDEKVYITDRKRIFVFKKQPGFSISKGIFTMLLKIGVKTIRVILKKEEGTAVFITTIDKWLKEGQKNYFGLKDVQLFLPIEKFDVVGE